MLNIRICNQRLIPTGSSWALPLSTVTHAVYVIHDVLTQMINITCFCSPLCATIHSYYISKNLHRTLQRGKSLNCQNWQEFYASLQWNIENQVLRNGRVASLILLVIKFQGSLSQISLLLLAINNSSPPKSHLDNYSKNWRGFPLKMTLYCTSVSFTYLLTWEIIWFFYLPVLYEQSGQGPDAFLQACV